MPARETVDAFIALVEQAQYVEALEGYYTSDSTMTENQEPPRVGLAAHIASERAVMGAFKALKTHPVSRVLIDGDLVMINWVFEFTENVLLMQSEYHLLGPYEPTSITMDVDFNCMVCFKGSGSTELAEFQHIVRNNAIS